MHLFLVANIVSNSFLFCSDTLCSVALLQIRYLSYFVCFAGLEVKRASGLPVGSFRSKEFAKGILKERLLFLERIHELFLIILYILILVWKASSDVCT